MALEDLYGKVLALGAQVIRRETCLPRLVNNTPAGDREQAYTLGGVTEVIVPPEFVARDVVPAPTPPASQAAPNPTTVQVNLNYWKEVNFPLTEKQISLLENADAQIPMFLANAVSPIVEAITAAIAANYKGIYGYVGTAGVTPFAAAPTDAQNAKKVLTRQKCPKFMRRLVLNTDAYGNATGLDAFARALNYGSAEVVREGEINRAYGFDWHEDAGMDGITHTNPNGTPAGWLVNQANHALGNTTVVIDTGANAPVVGDIFTVAGDSQTYAVVGFAANTITYVPAARAAWANNAAITFRAAHAINLAFHPMAFAFDSRPATRLRIPGVTSNFMTWVDDMTGVVLRLEIRDEYHQTGFYLSCLWGNELVDARLATRIAG
ncbi:hypothetical protein [Leptothoe sp. PORK10 BA2]|uniref:hypothetical protein n=1 Tax=Leptothoe sp. PORK10 BA2 TaxID=3110254 RepID=UPI002B2113C4|nr:hypothetical protein [Leptothoe sp. PORK10 BA2]MEA5465269.1 hypothetical protein [Leptothoe sp. PORK10 BA2]